MITVVGLGPGDAGLVTQQTLEAIEAHKVCFLRTRQHPSAHLLPDADSFDDIYDSADTFADVYDEIVERLSVAAEEGPVLYAVPGSPLILEQTVRAIRERNLPCKILPAVSFLDSVWAALAIDPVEAGIRLIDGHTFALSAAGESGPMVVAHTHANWVLSDIKLAADPPLETSVIILQRLGTSEETITSVLWEDLDRTVEADHLTSLYIPSLGEPVAHDLVRSVELIHRLRKDCPWDAEQTHASLRRHLLEETYEVLEALDAVDPEAGTGYEHLEEELGDLWFQILFHSELATEQGQFTIADVARGIYDKLVSRHPHVFGEAEAADSAAVLENWEQAKVREKNRESVMDGIPAALPALTFTEKILKKGMRGKPVEWPDTSVAELASPSGAITDESVGRALLATVELARRHGVDPEGALRSAAIAARDRFREIEHVPAPPRENWILG